MPAFQLHFPAPGLALNSSRSDRKTDEVLLHDDLTKRDARSGYNNKPLKPKPCFSLKGIGTFHFHRTEHLGDGSALLLNLRGIQLIHNGSIEQIDARSKYPSSETWGDDEIKQTINEGDRVWVPHHVTESIDIGGYTRSYQQLKNKYYPAKILSGRNYTAGRGDLCGWVLVEFDGGQKSEVHIGDIRDTNPPARGRGGDKRFLCNFTIWAPPFPIWNNDKINVDINPQWTPGENIKRIVGGLEVQFTVPRNLEKLPWNKKKTARCFTLKINTKYMESEWKYKKHDWDELNKKAEDQKALHYDTVEGVSRIPNGVEELYHSGEAKIYEDSPFRHYMANVEKANPDGTIVLRFKNGYTINDYNPDWISDDQLDSINYRRPREGIPYNPPDFEEGEFVYIDYERQGKLVYSFILKKNANGTYETGSLHREHLMGQEVIVEETAHDIIYKKVNEEWGVRTGWSSDWRGCSVIPMEKEKQKTLHRILGRDKVPHKSTYKKIVNTLEQDGILAWATWFRRSENKKMENINLTQMCLGQIEYYSEKSIISGGYRYIMKPAIFAWSTWDKQDGVSAIYDMCWRTNGRYQWIPLKTITKNDVKGVPLLEGFYKKALKNHGSEEGNADLFAEYFMKFAEGRNKNTLRRWRPQEFETEEDTLEKTPEEKQYDLLLSANVRLEENNRKMEKMMMKMEKKIECLENGEEPKVVSRWDFDDYKEWTEREINLKILDSNQIMKGHIKKEKNKDDTFRFITNVTLLCAGAYVIDCAMKYWC